MHFWDTGSTCTPTPTPVSHFRLLWTKQLIRSAGDGRVHSELANGIFPTHRQLWGYQTQYILRYVPAKNTLPKRFRTIKVQVPSCRMCTCVTGGVTTLNAP